MHRGIPSATITNEVPTRARSHPPGLQYSALRGRPLTAIFRGNDRNLKNINILSLPTYDGLV
jgi:hypothetical protein